MPTSRLSQSARVTTVAATAALLVLASCNAPANVRNVPEQEATQTETINNIATQMPNEPAEIEGELAVSNQESDGTFITLDAAMVGDRDPDFEEGTRGFVVVYTDENGSPATPIGQRQVTALATGERLEVPLDDPIEQTQDLWAVLHWDSDTSGQFEPGVDSALVDNATGDVLMEKFRVVVQDG